MVQDAMGKRCVFSILTIQILADHLDVSLLTHLFRRFHPKTDVASVCREKEYVLLT